MTALKRSSRKGTKTPSPPSSVNRQYSDASITALQSLQHKPQVAIYAPFVEHDNLNQAQGVSAMHNALERYLTGWFHLPLVRRWNFDAPAHILIVDEVHLPTLLAQVPDLLDTACRQRVIIFCEHAKRQAIMDRHIQSGHVEFLCKHFGPYKLARTICRILEKTAKPETVRLPSVGIAALATDPFPTRGTLETEEMERRDFRRCQSSIGFAADNYLCPPNITQRTAATSEILVTPPELNSSSIGGFPFPVQASPSEPAINPEHSPGLSQSCPMCGRLKTGQPKAEANTNPTSSLPTPLPGSPTAVAPPASVQLRRPRLLLVDDNKVNLKLLHSFVKKRGYGSDLVDTAEDGLQVVNIFQKRMKDGVAPEVVIMDISMPVMDGYEATRVIRQYEESERQAAASPDDGSTVRQPRRSLIVALTGNSSECAQSEAVESGMDVFITKPMKMKEVGKLLDEWNE